MWAEMKHGRMSDLGHRTAVLLGSPEEQSTLDSQGI